MQVPKSVLLGVAFAAILVVVALSALSVWRNATLAQQRVAALHRDYARAGDSISAIRANIYAIAILTRDYLIDPDPSRAEEWVRQFDRIRSDTRQSFEVLESMASDEQQRAALVRLSKQVAAYWDPTENMLDWTPQEKALHRSLVLRQRVRSRREIFDLVEQAEALMTGNFDRERQRITHTDEEFRRSLGWSTAFTLAIGMCIAGLTLVRMVRLEHQSQTAELQLRDLSAQLRTAQESERKRLSRELHDQVGQMLTGLRMELAALARTSASADPDVANRIVHAKTNVEQTLKLVRNIAMLMRPSMLDDLGLRPALTWHAKEFSRSTGVHVETAIDDQADHLPERYRTCIYRVVQEALTNCARHASASQVTITLQRADGLLRLAVEDDGTGFDTTGPRKHGLGLVGMEERVRELRGRLFIYSAPGAGTRVEAHLPVPVSSEESDDSDPDRGRSRDRSDRVETAL